MLQSDFMVFNEVRRELVRTQADLGRIQFSVTQGVIYFGGEFWVRVGVKKLEGQKYFDALVSTLIGLEKRLRRIAGVADIFFRFNNIDKRGGFWHRPDTRPKSSTTRPAFRGITPSPRGGEATDRKEDESP